MSEMERLEERLRAFGSGSDGGADWGDVLHRAGSRVGARHVPRRRLVLAVAAAVVLVGAAVALAVSWPAKTGSASPTGPNDAKSATGSNGATGVAMGPTGSVGPTGYAGATGDRTTSRGPVAMDENQLKREAAAIGSPVYWAGPVKGDVYELTRLAHEGSTYVRYLPADGPAGTTGSNFLIVATYPLPNAFSFLKARANYKTVPGPDGSIIAVNPNNPKSVLLAFPGVDYEIEIYNPSAAKALAIAQSGMISPVVG